MRSAFLGMMLTAVLAAQESDFTVQLPPISTTVAIGEVELSPLEYWQAKEVLPSDLATYLLPVRGIDLVISVPAPELFLPQTVTVESTAQREDE